MNYILMGILLSVGWHIVKLIYEVAEELLFERLHKAKWYMAAAGRKPKEVKEPTDRPGEIKAVKNKIGFC